eukprot:TRINITY_DN111596_c0_g1_i1.p1 TRINITY_DN111596_c0_g1~~TRINITY_DN111596_c0_g1_i1.p1  ORF type:complete len:308 (+),score=97.79 TRINITY_DN111596_c0_g1_i1:80-1003(+)
MADETKKGIDFTAIFLPIFFGLLSVAFILWRRSRETKSDEDDEEREAELERAKAEERRRRGAEAMPKDGVFTIPLLGKFDGLELPLCLGVCGKVVDVSSSENIKPGDGYGKLWSGRDATWALATLSLKSDDANRLDFKVSDFTEDQHKALAGWYKHFTTKYPVVGRLKEYEGWDFSSVEEAAKAERPFGAAAEMGQGIEPKAAESAAAPAPAPAPAEEEQVVLKRGCTVVVKQCEDDAALVGATGTLVDFVATKGRFEVKLADGRGTHLFKPSEIRPVPAKKAEEEMKAKEEESTNGEVRQRATRAF